MSSLIRKIDETIYSELRGHPHTHTTTTATGAPVPGTETVPHYRAPRPHTNLPGPAPNTAGPHRTDLANRLDPMVDSDMSNPRTAVAYACRDPSTGPASRTAGPHHSNLLNKLDCRVDSDLSSVRAAAAVDAVRPLQSVPETAYERARVPHGAGVVGGKREAEMPPVTRPHVPEGTYGPHRSKIANALDPRVDSDHDGSYRMVAGTNYTTAPGYANNAGTAPRYVPEGTYGPHHSRTANAMDPRVDSDLDGGYGHNAGAPLATGPHRSHVANKLDPRVDSAAAGAAARASGPY